MSPFISLDNVSYAYKAGDEKIGGVRHVNLSIEEGSFVVILGKNGSGKSTLSKLINGFLVPDEGKVTVDGIDVADESQVFEIRQRVGMVFQNPDNQMVASIIEDDIAFGPENLGVPSEEIRRRVDWALDAVGMSEYRNHTPFKLSGGQKQRIAIAAILAMLPGAVIFDESTSMLDPAGRKEVLEVIKKLNRDNGMTVLLVTHYMDEAVDADKVVVMADGEIVGIGTPEEVFGNHSVIERANIDMPVATKVAYMLKDEFPLGAPLTDEELVEAICRLK